MKKAKKKQQQRQQRRVVTEAEQKSLFKLPLHSSADIYSYAKPGEGFERIAPKAFAYLQRNPTIAAALKIDVEHLRTQFKDAAKLTTLEESLKVLTRHAEENRLEHQSEIYRAILKLNRFAQNSDDAEVQREISPISEWIADSHAAATATATPPEPKAPKS